MKGTFVLGIGAQKSGTSWVYRYLEQNPNFRSGVKKEYHIWDALEIPLFRRNLVRFPKNMIGASRYRYRMQTDPNFYFSYFESLLSKDTDIVADVTPSYSMLKVDTLRRIKDEFNKRGIEFKCVFLVRDPIERCRSAVKMNLNRGNFREGVSRGNTEFCSALDEYYRSEHAEVRTRYDLTIENMKAAYAEDVYYIGVYETMFAKENVLRLSEFLGIEPNIEFAEVKIFPGRGHSQSCKEIERKIFAKYRSVYDYCGIALPETELVWTGNTDYRKE